MQYVGVFVISYADNWVPQEYHGTIERHRLVPDWNRPVFSFYQLSDILNVLKDSGSSLDIVRGKKVKTSN